MTLRWQVVLLIVGGAYGHIITKYAVKVCISVPFQLEYVL